MRCPDIPADKRRRPPTVPTAEQENLAATRLLRFCAARATQSRCIQSHAYGLEQLPRAVSQTFLQSQTFRSEQSRRPNRHCCVKKFPGRRCLELRKLPSPRSLCSRSHMLRKYGRNAGTNKNSQNKISGNAILVPRASMNSLASIRNEMREQMRDQEQHSPSHAEKFLLSPNSLIHVAEFINSIWMRR